MSVSRLRGWCDLCARAVPLSGCPVHGGKAETHRKRREKALKEIQRDPYGRNKR